MLKDIKNLERFEAIEEDQEITPNIEKLFTRRWTVCGSVYHKRMHYDEPLIKL